MDTRKLVKMANEIAAFFAAEPDPVARFEGIAGHLKRFWEPRMRASLLKLLDDPSASGLSETAVQALRAHRESLTPRDHDHVRDA